MPIVPSIAVNRIEQEEFKALSFRVMEQVIAIHNEFGRFFDEQVYKRELAERLGGIDLEVAVDVVHKDFTKRYYADVLSSKSGLFELKAAEAIHPRHRSQAIHYLLLLGLAHGKVDNVRPEKVEHEFVNCHRQLAELRNPAIREDRWDNTTDGAEIFREQLLAMLNDWGTGLELSLYEEAMTHLLGGEQSVLAPVPVYGTGGHISNQRMRLVAPDVAFKLTAISDRRDEFVVHARRLINHTSLKAILWSNIRNNEVVFSTVKEGQKEL